MDIDGEALRTAQSRLFELGVDNRISTLCADVEKLPLRDNLADFIMCRGSIGFWPVPVQGITEIYRVLKPGGCAIVGVGAGRYMPETMRRRIYESMSASDRTTSPANILLKITMPLPVRPCCRITASLSRMIYPKDVGWK